MIPLFYLLSEKRDVMYNGRAAQQPSKCNGETLDLRFLYRDTRELYGKTGIHQLIRSPGGCLRLYDLSHQIVRWLKCTAPTNRIIIFLLLFRAIYYTYQLFHIPNPNIDSFSGKINAVDSVIQEGDRICLPVHFPLSNISEVAPKSWTHFCST